MTKIINIIGSPDRVLIRREPPESTLAHPADYTDRAPYTAQVVMLGRMVKYLELQPGQRVLVQYGGAQPCQHDGETLHLIPAFDILAIL